MESRAGQDRAVQCMGEGKGRVGPGSGGSGRLDGAREGKRGRGIKRAGWVRWGLYESNGVADEGVT